MVFAGVLVGGQEIRLGALTFLADDSAWLQEAPLDVNALPVRGATHFRACVLDVLLRQPSTIIGRTLCCPPFLFPTGASAPVGQDFSGVRHAVARQSATPQVVAIEPDESLYGLFDWLRRDCIRVRQQ